MDTQRGLLRLVGVIAVVALAVPASVGGADEALQHQIAELRARVATLEAALGGQEGKSGGMAMGGGMQGSGMGMAGSGAKGMHHAPGGGMPSGAGAPPATGMGMEGMGMAGGGMAGSMEGMEMMGRMPGAAEIPMSSALPGFPGVSHVYHVGTSGLFLNHAEHVGLTPDQQATLGRLREKMQLDQASRQRAIDAAEQDLWTLTSSDQPDAGKIEAKIRELEKLRGDRRLAFVRSVGEAARVLTDDQRKRLLGQMPPAGPRAVPSMPSGSGVGEAPPQPPPATPGMGHM